MEIYTHDWGNQVREQNLDSIYQFGIYDRRQRRREKADWPTPGPNEPVPSWPEYDQLKEAINDYLDHEPHDPQWQALAAIMGEYQRGAFAEAYDLDCPADRACIARFIDGRNECPHHAGQDDDPHAPPHKPPTADHSTL